MYFVKKETKKERNYLQSKSDDKFEEHKAKGKKYIRINCCFLIVLSSTAYKMHLKKVPFVSGPLFHDNLAENLSYITIL